MKARKKFEDFSLEEMTEKIGEDQTLKFDKTNSKKFAKPNCSANNCLEYAEEHGKFPPLHNFTPKTIDDSKRKYLEGNEHSFAVCIAKLTYEEASFILSYYNRTNRTWNIGNIDVLAKEMLQHEWRGCSSITFSDEEGKFNLLDGQHRLAAFIQACDTIMSIYPEVEIEDLPTIPVVITFNVPAPWQLKLDRGSKRTYNNMHTLEKTHGYTTAKNPSCRATIARMAEYDKVSPIKMTGANRTVSDKDVEEQNVKYLTALNTLDDFREKFGIKGKYIEVGGKRRNFGTLDTALVKFLYHKPSEADRFISELVTGDITNPRISPINALLKYLDLNWEKALGQRGQKKVHGIALAAIKNYIEEVPTNSLSDEDSIPSIDWDNI